MASILIPTDLSEGSLNAAVYASRLFGRQAHRITLLNENQFWTLVRRRQAHR